jgi:hydrogenase maturation protease
VPADVAAGPRVLVLGVGNPIMSDDGVGQRLLQALAARAPALDGVEFLDAGTLGLVLLPRLERFSALLVLDAAHLGGEPGEWRVYEGAQLDEFLKTARTSVHELGLRDLLDAARLMGSLPACRALVGVQPAQLRWGTELSPSVEAAIPAATAVARQLLEHWLRDNSH